MYPRMARFFAVAIMDCICCISSFLIIISQLFIRVVAEILSVTGVV